jgi:putative membrane protein
MAFLHHVAAFTLVAAISIEFVLIRGDITLKSARQLLVVDALTGISAMLVLVIGSIRVYHFEKGTAYYFHSIPFIAKMSLFVIVALISIGPTREFLSWRKALAQGQVPVLTDERRRQVRRWIHWELAGILLILLCAAMMAKGVGYRP